MIPDEAVEAAWDAFSMGRESMRKALEAAAPHMLAAAWQKGRSAGQMDPYDRYPAKNPYRSEQ